MSGKLGFTTTQNPTGVPHGKFGRIVRTSVTVNASGNKLSRQMYMSWDETRFRSLPTQYQYTGQWTDSYIDLYGCGSN
jgi:hypothetical protein